MANRSNAIAAQSISIWMTTNLYRCLCYPNNFVPMQRNNRPNPIRHSIGIPTILRRWRDTVHDSSNWPGILRWCNAFHSNRWHRDRCHFCIGHARCIGHRTILYYKIHHPNRCRMCTSHQHIYHVNHSSNRIILLKLFEQVNAIRTNDSIAMKDANVISYVRAFLPFEQSSPLHLASQLHVWVSKSNVPCPVQSGKHCNASWSIVPQSGPFHPFLQMHVPAAQ